MNNRKNYLLPLILGVAAFAALLPFGIGKLTVFGQQNSLVAGAESQPTAGNAALSRPLVVKTAAVSSSAFRAASAVNSNLKNSLPWTFGGRTQRGWSLYSALIQQEIGTDDAAETPEFALRLADWQGKNALPPTGVLDSETLGAFIKLWQSRRLNSSLYPAPEQLMGAPITDFYDPTRGADLLKVKREAYAAFKKMVAAACADKSLNLKTDDGGNLAPDEKFMRIVSAFRSREYQAQLRVKSPHSGSAGLAVNSPHFTGHALDIYVGGEPVTTKDFNRQIQVQTPVYKWLVKNAARFGFYPYFYEPWHWEYVPAK